MSAKKKLSFEQKKARWGWFFTLPGIVFFSLFSFFPIINAIITSLYNKKLLSLKKPAFVGLTNYIKILSSPDFWNSMKATAIFTLGCFIPLVVVCLLLAALITSRNKGKRAYQMVLYSPAVLSSVVIALIWMILLDPRGLMNQIFNTISGQSGVDFRWLSDSKMVRLSTIIIYFWKYVGYFTILYITGIGKIPNSVYEAATIDGASKMQQFWLITVPLLKPTVVMVSIMAMIQCIKTFSTQYMFTQSGAPLAPINVITLNIYNTAMRDLAISKASVMSIILFLIMLALTCIQFRFSKSDDVSY
ncbi:MAG: sugar ABC transporter permease [Spirochaetaceae bacterium]|nr:sugar ABC transporter permease [Spirochaetaceae bacterium]